ncbi:MAG TPA: hypothetical protein VN285_00225 [Candidatus Deferrimicrobium sp.]|nr:hypothetical protein [Candidatus Deferrimicrobium sp.]
MNGIARDSVVEFFDRKFVYVFIALTTLASAVAVLSQPEIHVRMDGGLDAAPMADWLRNPVTKGLSLFLWFMVFLSVLATADLVPQMLTRGRADFYLSKPISRTSLLLSKVFGIWCVYGATLVICGLMLYILTVLRQGLFDWGAFYLFAFNLVIFFIWLSVITAAGVISRSGGMAILVAAVIWAAQALLSFREGIVNLGGSKSLGRVLDVFYYVLPKPGEIGELADALALGHAVASWQPVYSSLLFAAVGLIVAVVVFKRQSY